MTGQIRAIHATLKRELGDTWATAGQARLRVFGWIACYNRRRHSTLGYRSPVGYETDLTIIADAAAAT